MSAALQQYIGLDLPAMLAASFCALSCAVLGSFLTLRRQSMMGDAIAHVVLPGLVISFLVTASRDPVPMVIGAALSGLIAAVLSEVLRKHGNLDGGASMGVVFALSFAVGVLLMEQASARAVDLDPDCLIHGQLERIFWFPPDKFADLLTFSALTQLPREVWSTAAVFVLSLIFCTVFFKELRLASFDPQFGSVAGFSPSLVNILLMAMIALAVVASFEAVGAILVIALLVVPSCCARMFTDCLRRHFILSALFGLVAVLAGYTVAAHAPFFFGLKSSLNAAGMITCMLGVCFIGAMLFATQYGIVGRFIRQRLALINSFREDLLARLFRDEELGTARAASDAQTALPGAVMRRQYSTAWNSLAARLGAWSAERAGEVTGVSDMPRLTDLGRLKARQLIRSHRLWESFMVSRLDWPADHVHLAAEDFEHVTSRSMAEELVRAQGGVNVDPHDRPIPKEVEMSMLAGKTSKGEKAN